jgi:glycosyltransferase involved in cell wall biosynthesis
MNILHYAIGLPPVRHGGMVQYVLDLMDIQVCEGKHQVALLFPGACSLVPRASIRSLPARNGVALFEIVNASDMAVSGGVANPERILHPRHSLSPNVLERLFDQLRPDVVHVHSFMGMPANLLEIAHQRGARVVYTTHDYYGLCYTLHFLYPDGALCSRADGLQCAKCCRHAARPWELYLRSQPWIYAFRERLNALRGHSSHCTTGGSKKAGAAAGQSYDELSAYYRRLFAQVDIFHFNSSVSAEVFHRQIAGIQGRILGVSNCQVKDCRVERVVDPAQVRIGFMGGVVPGKGLPGMLAAGRSLLEMGIANWKMIFWGVAEVSGLPKSHYELGRDFTRSQVHQVYGSLDLLVVPSEWPETFGLVVLEALSVGLPVLVSDLVGAQDVIIHIDESFVYRNGTAGLVRKLSEVLGDVKKLERFNRTLLALPFDYDMAHHALGLEALYLS